MGSKAARKVPDVLLEWLDKNVSPEFAKWYAKNSRLGARQITTERQRMSADAGTVGAYHEGHFRGAKDVDPKMGGGPTTGLTMRPEIGVVNVAHAEAPRIPYEDMRKAGIPQNWVEDVFESILYSEGLGVIGNFDTQAAMDMDAGDVTPGQAMAQTDRRQQLRQQNVKQVGPDTSVKLKPFEGDIKVNPDAELPNLTEGLTQQLEKEKRQIANRRSVRAASGEAEQVFSAIRNAVNTVPGSKALLGTVLPAALGFGFDAADAAEKTERAAKPDATDLDKFQAGLAQSTAATSLIPEPVTQAYNMGSGLLNTGIDFMRAQVHRYLIENRRPLSRY